MQHIILFSHCKTNNMVMYLIWNLVNEKKKLPVQMNIIFNIILDMNL